MRSSFNSPFGKTQAVNIVFKDGTKTSVAKDGESSDISIQVGKDWVDLVLTMEDGSTRQFLWNKDLVETVTIGRLPPEPENEELI